jgi:hypothetical protein
VTGQLRNIAATVLPVTDPKVKRVTQPSHGRRRNLILNVENMRKFTITSNLKKNKFYFSFSRIWGESKTFAGLKTIIISFALEMFMFRATQPGIEF